MDDIAKDTFKRSYGVVRTAAQQRRRETPIMATMAGRTVFNLGIMLDKALAGGRRGTALAQTK